MWFPLLLSWSGLPCSHPHLVNSLLVQFSSNIPSVVMKLCYISYFQMFPCTSDTFDFTGVSLNLLNPALVSFNLFPWLSHMNTALSRKLPFLPLACPMHAHTHIPVCMEGALLGGLKPLLSMSPIKVGASAA